MAQPGLEFLLLTSLEPGGLDANWKLVLDWQPLRILQVSDIVQHLWILVKSGIVQVSWSLLESQGKRMEGKDYWLPGKKPVLLTIRYRVTQVDSWDPKFQDGHRSDHIMTKRWAAGWVCWRIPEPSWGHMIIVTILSTTNSPLHENWANISWLTMLIISKRVDDFLHVSWSFYYDSVSSVHRI